MVKSEQPVILDDAILEERDFEEIDDKDDNESQDVDGWFEAELLAGTSKNNTWGRVKAIKTTEDIERVS